MLKSSLIYVATIGVFLITTVDGGTLGLKNEFNENDTLVSDLSTAGKDIFEDVSDEDYVEYQGKNLTENTDEDASFGAGEENENRNMNCGSPPKIEGAIAMFLKSSEQTVGTTVKYKCNFGYVSRNSGNFLSNCKINEQTGKEEWTNPAISCVARSCGDPGYVTNGRHIGNLFTFPNKVEFKCEVGYKLQGLNARFCQASGEWSGRLPFCEPVFCPIPLDPVNGRVLYSSLEYGTELRYECNRGFILRNLQTRFCTNEGKWSNDEPECIEARCERPTAPVRGSMQMFGEPRVGSLAMYTCDDDTTMVGASTSKCLDTGIWTFDSPKCLRSCTVIDVKNGSVGTMKEIRRYSTQFVREGDIVKHGESVSLRCRSGFTPTNRSTVSNGGSDEVLCNDGEWSKPMQCAAMECLGDPPKTENGFPVVTNRSHGSVIWYKCTKPFQKLQTGRVQCDEGTWKGFTPVCGDPRCYINQLNFPGLVKPRAPYFNNGSSFGIKCDSGYKKTANENKVTCYKGKWNITENPCSDDPPSAKDAFPLQFKREHGSVVNCECAEPFEMVKISTIRCEIGKWIGDPPQCQETTNVKSLKGGELITTEIKETSDVTTERSSSSLSPYNACFCSFDFQTGLVEATLGNRQLNGGSIVSRGKTVSFRCRYPGMQLLWPNGSKFYGKVNVTCNNCERWAQTELPTCERDKPGDSYLAFRQEMMILPGGVIEISKNSNFEFRCINFYTQPDWHGAKINGIHSFPDSEERVSRNRFYSSYLSFNSVDYEHTGKYECFARDGNFRGTSLELKISEVVPEIQCPELLNVRGQFIIKYENGRRVNTAAYYTCTDTRKKLIGDNSRTCKRNGKWSGSYPSCEDITCPEFTIYNGLVVSYTNGNKIHSTANFHCSPNTVLLGSNLTECLSSGIWSNPQPICQMLELDIRCPVVDGKGIFSIFYSNDRKFNSIAQFYCKDADKKVSGCSYMTCQQNGEWSGDYPTCVDIVACNPFERSDGLEISYSNGVKAGSTATFSCSLPKQLSGSASSICQDDGSWSQHPPICETPRCSIDILMDSIPEGVVPDMSEVIANVDGFLEYDSELQFLCEDNLILTGSSTARCGLGGNWVYGTVECIRGCRLGIDVSPQLLVEPSKEHYVWGEMITFSCLPGQKLSSDVERVMCLGNSWSDPIPGCEEITG